jgi:hypothetical protein
MSISESQLLSLSANRDVLRKSYSMPLSIEHDYPSSPTMNSNAINSKTLSPNKINTLIDDQNDSSSTGKNHPSMIRTSKSEEVVPTTTQQQQQPQLPQHKLDRYGFIVNMDSQGNVVPSQSSTNRNNYNNHVQHRTSSTRTSNYSIDTNYDRPTPTRPGPTNIAPDGGSKVLDVEDDSHNTQIVQKRNAKYYMQRRRRPPTIAEAARNARRVIKWNTMLRWNIPVDVVQYQKTAYDIEPIATSTYIYRRPISNTLQFNQKQRRYQTMKRRLRKGIPNQKLRAQIWPILCHVHTKMNIEHPGLYRSLLETSDQIECNDKPVVNGTGISTMTSSTTTTTDTVEGSSNMTTTTTNNNVDEMTKIELNYTKIATATTNNDTNKQSSVKARTQSSTATTTTNLKKPMLPLNFQYTKSFKSIQDTIERDLHRTFPRHCMFYTEDEDDETDHTNNDYRNDDERNGDHSFCTSNHSGNQPNLNGGDVDDDQHSIDTRDMQQKGICGTHEISNLIRELDLVPMSTTRINAETKPTNINDQNKNANEASILNGSDNKTSSTKSKTNTKSTKGDGQEECDSCTSTGRNNSKTSPSNTSIFDGIGGQSRLRRVLKAYSVYDREIGYCQGMNFIAAMFLTLVTEECAFWMLVGTYTYILRMVVDIVESLILTSFLRDAE